MVVGGNSVLQGVGQRPSHIWTLHLQQLLGDDYVVVNLAMRGGTPRECASLIAERLHADGVPVILVTNGHPTDWQGSAYRYFFWDAWGKGHLLPDPRRDSWLANFTATYASAEVHLEGRRQGQIDAVAYAADLWTAVAYKYRASVWSSVKYPKFWRPYRNAVDTDPGATLDFDARLNPSPDSIEVVQLRQFLNLANSKMVLGDAVSGTTDPIHARTAPASLKERQLFVFCPDNPYYRSRLTPQEQADYDELHRRHRDALVLSGHPAQLVEQYVQKDYIDKVHLSERGGKKLAEDLAPTIRAMGERLYGPKPATPEGAKP